MNEQTLNFLKDGSVFFTIVMPYIIGIVLVCVLSVASILIIWCVLEKLVEQLMKFYYYLKKKLIYKKLGEKL